MNEANAKDLAEFARHAIRFSLLDYTSIRSWGDTILSSQAVSPLWAIELACAKASDVDDHLRHVPGTASEDLAVCLFCALLRRRWHARQLTIGDVRDAGWYLHINDLLPPMNGESDWGVVLECEGEEFDDWWRTKDHMDASITEKLAPYAEYELLLPPWVP
jgi:hypothetical protein